ncbi:chemotaxis protein CheW [Methylophaga lonarensis]|uniref:chemotaxis protein CheW n=1 Tax=Methylophaga lonarensis TaxID=999151 RepID=UPI003D288C52
MQGNPEHTSSFKHLPFSQVMEHFDPYQGLIDTREKEEQLRNLRYGFKIGSHQILIDQKILCEVVQNLEIYKLPNTEKWVLGMINLRGNLVPVFDLKARLGGHTNDIDDVYLLVIEQGDHAAGVQIDGLPQALEINPDSPEQKVAVPDDTPAVLKAHARDAFSANGNTWLEIDHRGLFAKLLADSGITVVQNTEAESASL